MYIYSSNGINLKKNIKYETMKKARQIEINKLRHKVRPVIQEKINAAV